MVDYNTKYRVGHDKSPIKCRVGRYVSSQKQELESQRPLSRAEAGPAINMIHQLTLVFNNNSRLAYI